MFQKIKGVLIYTFYRTVNHYNMEDRKRFKRDLVAEAFNGATIFWLILGNHLYFLLCLFFSIFGVDITWFNKLLYMFLGFIPSLFCGKIERMLLLDFKKWRKENKTDPRWVLKGWLVSFFYVFNFIEWFIEYQLHRYLME